MTDFSDVWDHPEPFSITVSAQKEDIDSFGHVNNAVYLRWLTECAWAHSAYVGLPEEVCVTLRRGMAVRNVQLDMVAATYLDDELKIGNWLTECNGLRATRVYQIVNLGARLTILRGRLDFVCLNLDNGRPTRMPKEFLQGYATNIRSDV
jgi:acyl-CoA thioester hydrolase